MRARRSLGQNFLVDPNLQRKIVAALEPTATDDVLEIGPGTGALSRYLAGAVRRLTLIELDERCVQTLRAELGDRPGVRVLHADALTVDLEREIGDVAALKVVGNIPYNITTPLLGWLLDRPVRPALIVLMVQREVADRIAAEPGTKAYGALTVGVRTVADVERLFIVGRNAFRPVPDVDSAVLRIVPHRPPHLTTLEEQELRTLTRTAFSMRRKQLQKILRSAEVYRLSAEDLDAIADVSGIDLMRRPETLSPGELLALTRVLLEMRRGGSPGPARLGR